MEFSSDDSFAWTSASSDSEVEMDQDEESESGKSFKKKLKKELLLNGNHEESSDVKKETKKKKAKRENRSPSPKDHVNGHVASPDAEQMLRIKVKEERASLVDPTEPSTPRKKKKRRRETERSVSEHTPQLEDEPAEPESETESPRKKKKRRRETEGSDASKEHDLELKVERERTHLFPSTNSERRQSESTGNAATDFESPRKEKKRRRETDGSDALKEHDLKLKVEQERINFFASTKSQRRQSECAENAAAESESPRRKKKRRRETEGSVEPPADDSRVDDADGPPKKKKKKRAERSTDETSEPVVDKFEAEETVVETRRPAPGPAPASPARNRISELITFESELELEPSLAPSPSPAASPSASPAAGRLGRFLRAHAHMQPVLGALAPGASVSADDDVWLLECPRDLAPGALLGATLAPGARRKLAAGGRAYEAAPTPSAARVALLARGAGLVLRAVPLCGALRLRPRVPRVRAPEPAPEPAPAAVPLPHTRPRHPLLGAGYERALRLPKAVRRRLQAALEPEPEPEPEPDVPDADANERREKKKKKKKHRERVSPEEPIGANGAAEPGPEPAGEVDDQTEIKKAKKKAKKEKRRRDDSALWESERAIEESLFG